MNAIFPEESVPAEWAALHPRRRNLVPDKAAARAEVDALKPA